MIKAVRGFVFFAVLIVISVLLIAKGAGAQSVAVGEINIGVGQLDQVTQKNAAMAQETTESCLALQAQSRDLAEMVAVFRIDGAGHGRLTRAA